MSLETEVLSSTGGRNQNQDRCGYKILDNAGCWVLADGLGGHSGGEIAAGIAVDTVLQSFTSNSDVSAEVLEAHVAAANAAVCQAEASNRAAGELRTTVVILLSDYRRAVWAHVGDSRLYHLRGGRIVFQTKDHSVPQALVAAGDIAPEQIRFHEDRNRLLRALGNRSNARAAILSKPVCVSGNDAFLLCSDGFWEPVTEADIESEFSRGAGGALARLEAMIRNRPSEGADNYSAIAVVSASTGEER